MPADLEKAASGASGARGARGASGASGACRHFVGNHAILRTFMFKYPILRTKDGGRGVEDG